MAHTFVSLTREAEVAICKAIQSAMAGLMPEDRVLVFVQTLANGQQMAKALQCDFYRGTTDTTITNSDREAMVERWYSGVQKTMVATDAFGPGNDYPHVRYVYLSAAPGEWWTCSRWQAGVGAMAMLRTLCSTTSVAKDSLPAQLTST
ncbi:hypothetical protein C2E23DRAFT_890977 [Lenzites betulinus]|nr:hypothetical protein C2E23DRAFT_890977 [Lenzites betulinus]